MKLPFHVAARCLALALLLLGSCLSTPEPPAPNKSALSANPDTEVFQQAFRDRQYAAKLVQPATNADHTKSTWTWTPVWHRAVQKRTSAATYTYVPLEVYLETKPYVVTLLGCRRYLLIKATAAGMAFSAVTYVYDESKLKTQQAFDVKDLPYFTNFTGTTLVKNLGSGEQSCFSYLNGTRQSRANGQKPNTNQRGSKTAGCIITYVCEWTGYCAEATGGVTWQVYTSGVGGCPEPSGGACYLSMSWGQTGAWVDVYCDGNGGDDGGCGTCGGDTSGGGSGSTGPNPNSPCGKMTTLGNQQYIKQASANLLGLMGQDGEFGYAYRNNGLNGNDYEFRQSTNVSDEERRTIKWNQLAWPLDGLMHTHPPGSYTIFSISDLQAMYLLKRDNRMVDPATFTNFVFTASGDDYALKITNLNDFIDFGGTIATQDGIEQFEDKWLSSRPGKYNISESSSRAVNEQAFLRLLKERKTGLTMFKHDRNSDIWQQRDVDANKNPINIPCQ